MYTAVRTEYLLSSRIDAEVIKLNHFFKIYEVIMGGWGSGRREKLEARAYVEQFPRLTLAGLLAGWRDSIDGYILDDQLVVNAGHQFWMVDLSKTRHRWGGERRWMLCPQCGARCSVLYLRRAPACRRCHGLTYYRKTCDARSRLLARWAGGGHLGKDMSLPSEANTLSTELQPHCFTFQKVSRNTPQLRAPLITP